MTTHHAPLLPSFAGSWPASSTDEDAARAAILYAAPRLAQPTVSALSAVFYLADRLHLGRYGALMFGGHYEALKDGPVPVGVYWLLRAAQFGGAYGFSVQGQAAPIITAHTAPDMEELSLSVLECLGAVLAEHGQESGAALSALSRDEAFQRLSSGEVMSAALIASTLPNARAVLAYLTDPHPDD